MQQDLSREVADIHQQISNSQGRLYRLLDKMIIEVKNLEKQNNLLAMQILAKDRTLAEYQERIDEEEAELEAYKQQMEQMFYAKGTEDRPRKANNNVQIINQFEHIDQMAVGDGTKMNHENNSIGEAI